MKLEDFAVAHAISLEIAEARPYVRFEKGDVDLASSVNDGFPKSVQRLARTVAGQSGGFVIARNGFLSQIPPQLRPDDPVYTSHQRKPSYHPSKTGSKPVYTENGQRVFPLPAAALERHLAKHHNGVNVEGLHFHRRHAKYVLPPGEYGKRLDVHPLAWDKIKHAKRVFFVIEGSLKNDAILSQGEAVFCVPSVTLWDARELSVFITTWLRGKNVVIVPDADWAMNPLVIAQAMLCRTFLRSRGLRACVAAPPLINGEIQVDPVVGKLKGVDDYLAAGYSLDDMDVLEREAPDTITSWAALQRGFRQDRLVRDAKALSTLPLYADANGQIFSSLTTFGTILACHRNAARRTIEDLYHADAITVEGGSLDAAFQYVDPDGNAHDYDWDDRPRITFRDEFRAVENTLKLREWCGELNPISTPTWRPNLEQCSTVRVD